MTRRARGCSRTTSRRRCSLRPNPRHPAYPELASRLEAEGVLTTPGTLAPGALRVSEGRPVAHDALRVGRLLDPGRVSQIVPLLFPRAVGGDERRPVRRARRQGVRARDGAAGGRRVAGAGRGVRQARPSPRAASRRGAPDRAGEDRRGGGRSRRRARPRPMPLRSCPRRCAVQRDGRAQAASGDPLEAASPIGSRRSPICSRACSTRATGSCGPAGTSSTPSAPSSPRKATTSSTRSCREAGPLCSTRARISPFRERPPALPT